MTHSAFFRRGLRTRKSRGSAGLNARGGQTARRLRVEALEDRRVFAYDFGAAFALGGQGMDSGQAIAVDANSNTFLGANFDSALIDLDPGAGSYALPNAGGNDGLVAKYGPAGNLLWGAHFASTSHNGVSDVAADGSGNVFVTGYFMGSLEIGVPGKIPVTLTNAGVQSGFLAKLDSGGNVLWAHALGSADTRRYARGVAVDATGNAYTTGEDGAHGFFVSKYNAGGSAAWTKVISEGTGVLSATYGVYSSARSADVAVDDGGNVYVTGSFNGSGVDFNSDPKKSAKLTSVNHASDAFVMKLGSSGGFVWVGGMGGYGYDSGQGIAVDGNRNVFINGYNDSSTSGDYDPGRGKLELISGGFVVKLDTNRNLLWGRGGVGRGGIAVDGSGAVYTTDGFSGTVDADPGPGTFTLSASGYEDIRVTKLDSAGNFVWAGAMGGTGYNSGEAIAIDGAGSILTTGHFGGTTDFDPTADTYFLTGVLTASGDPTSDIFVSKLVPLAALNATSSATGGAASETLSHSEVEPLLSEALARWQAEGVDTSILGNIDIRIADLGGTVLGQASGHTIWLDDNAAGWGWFVDETPWDDGEFLTCGNQGEAGRMDLLSVVMHELGHLLDHDHEVDGVMAETLATGTWLTDHLSLTDAVFEEPGTRQDSWFVASLADFVESSRTKGKRPR